MYVSIKYPLADPTAASLGSGESENLPSYTVRRSLVIKTGQNGLLLYPGLRDQCQVEESVLWQCQKYREVAESRAGKKIKEFSVNSVLTRNMSGLMVYLKILKY